MLIGLSTAETISWGVLYYSFSVFIRPIEQEMGWSRTQVTGAFSVALLVSGLAAVGVGHWLDARGARGLMTAGAVLGTALFGALAAVHSLAALYAVWVGLGVAMAMVLYEPAFAVIATWFARRRDRALTVLTVFGGLASTVVVPLATWLLLRQGWRGAVVTLAVILGCTTIPLHALLSGARPPAAAHPRTGAPAGLAGVLSEARFWGLTAAVMLASLVVVATSVHLIPYLVGKGHSPAAAGAVLASVGFMQLPGRLLYGPLRRRLSWQGTATALFSTQAVALAVLAQATDRVNLVAFAGLFGLASGMSTLLRATTLVELYGSERYGRVSGVVSLFTTLGRAAGPLLASVAYVALGGYERTLGGLALFLVAAAVLVLVPWPVTGSTPRTA
jgi:MFS family permease